MKIFVLVGAGGSGKDYLFDKLKSTNIFNCIITTTSREKRPKEVDNVDYRFISKEQFEEEIKKGMYVEFREFNSWLYGTHIDSFSEDKPNLIVTSPDGYASLQSKFGNENVKGFYINAPVLIRAYRYIKRDRKIKKELFRRILSDRRDFKKINLFYNMETFQDYKDWKANANRVIEEAFNDR